MERKPSIYGLMAEFDNPTSLLAATKRAYSEGYRQMDAYTPFPVEGLSRALGFRRSSVPLIVLIGGLLGCLGGYFLQYYIAAIYWPLNVGGRPFNSWPMFIPVTFELTVLCAALFAFFGMLALNGLPKPHHPVFNTPRFELASRDRFFLCIEATDPKFDHSSTRSFLESLEAKEVSDVDGQ
jgi:ActD protein